MRLLNLKIPDPDINNSVSESPGGCQGVPDHSVEQEFFPTKVPVSEGRQEGIMSPSSNVEKPLWQAESNRERFSGAFQKGQEGKGTKKRDHKSISFEE